MIKQCYPAGITVNLAFITGFSCMSLVLPNLWLSGLRHLVSHQEVSGLRTGLKFDFFFFQIFQNCSIFQQFLFLCLFVNYCESGVHSFQFSCVLSTSSPIFKSLIP